MPSHYAHYRFGAAMVPGLTGDAQGPVKRFRQLYDVGLHGPDPFFYYSPVIPTAVGKLGHALHMQTGREFFQRVCRNLRLEPSEAGVAYLYGVLCHYCLDSVCHPFINQKAKEGFNHMEMETEFDRYLLELDGKTPACAQDRSGHICLTPEECETVARFYPSATAKHIRQGVEKMAAVTRMLTAPQGRRLRFLENAVRLLGENGRGLVMTASPDPRCAALDGDLMGLYRKACGLFPTLCAQLQAHLAHNAPLGEEFSPVFG